VTMIRDIVGHCPACGQSRLHLTGSGMIHCLNHDCPQPEAAHKVLSDPEIHHIVRFEGEDEYGVFNAQHPLRERIDGALLDCAIHEEVRRFVADGLAGSRPLTGTWRVKRRDDVDGEESNEWPYLWECVTP